MGLADIVETVRAGVFHIVALDDQNRRLATGTGFVSRSYFLTNHHVYVGCINAQNVWIRQEGDKLGEQGFTIGGGQLPKHLKSGSMESSYDYAILDLPDVVKRANHDFILRSPKGRKIGEQVALLGFPLEHDNLSCSDGVISSFYQSGVADIVQVDASVNSGNSGGPLIDHHTGHVLGIVTRKATGLTKLFASLRGTARANAKVAESAMGNMKIGGVDPMEAVKVSQNQLLQLSSEIERQANVGIG